MRTQKPTIVLWILLLASMLAVLRSHGSDIQRGITFQDGQRLTASQLHALIDNASITSGFIINKPSATSLESGAYFIVYSPAAQSLEKISASTAILGNTDLITSQAEKTSPAGNDFLLLYDSTGTVLAKVQVANIYSNTVGTLPPIAYTNASLTGTFVPVINGTNGIMSLSDLFLLFPYSAILTNLPIRTAPTNFDNLLLAASNDGTNFFNQRISLAGLITNAPPALTLTNAANTNGLIYATNVFLLGYQQSYTTNGLTNSTIVKFDYSTIKQQVTFSSTEIPVTNTLTSVSVPHGLPGTPGIFRAVLLCKTAEAGYVAGDELVMDTGVYDSNDGKVASYGENSTNLFLVFKIDGRLQVPNKTTGVITTLTGANGAFVPNWRLKFYATFFP